MNNIFEGAKIGDMFRTRNGRVAVLYGRQLCKYGLVLLQEYGHLHACIYEVDYKGEVYHEIDKGKDSLDIVSKYKEPIDEEKLDELAFNAEKETFKEQPELPFQTKWVEGFKAGYRKAMEE